MTSERRDPDMYLNYRKDHPQQAIAEWEAWKNYELCCRMGGTQQERDWTFKIALEKMLMLMRHANREAGMKVDGLETRKG